MKIVVVLVIVLASCKEQPKPPSASATTSRSSACQSALVSFDRFVDTGDPAATPADRARVKATILERCIQDAWSDEALTCMRAATSSHALFACWNAQLTQEQRDAASRALGNSPEKS